MSVRETVGCCVIVCARTQHLLRPAHWICRTYERLPAAAFASKLIGAWFGDSPSWRGDLFAGMFQFQVEAFDRNAVKQNRLAPDLTDVRPALDLLGSWR